MSLIKQSEPKFKDGEHYLHPMSWCGNPVPAGFIGPWGLNETCWYVVVDSDGYRKVFAAETAARATEAARKWLALGAVAD